MTTTHRPRATHRLRELVREARGASKRWLSGRHDRETGVRLYHETMSARYMVLQEALAHVDIGDLVSPSAREQLVLAGILSNIE